MLHQQQPSSAPPHLVATNSTNSDDVKAIINAASEHKAASQSPSSAKSSGARKTASAASTPLINGESHIAPTVAVSPRDQSSGSALVGAKRQQHAARANKKLPTAAAPAAKTSAAPLINGKTKVARLVDDGESAAATTTTKIGVASSLLSSSSPTECAPRQVDDNGDRSANIIDGAQSPPAGQSNSPPAPSNAWFRNTQHQSGGLQKALIIAIDSFLFCSCK